MCKFKYKWVITKTSTNLVICRMTSFLVNIKIGISSQVFLTHSNNIKCLRGCQKSPLSHRLWNCQHEDLLCNPRRCQHRCSRPPQISGGNLRNSPGKSYSAKMQFSFLSNLQWYSVYLVLTCSKSCVYSRSLYTYTDIYIRLIVLKQKLQMSFVVKFAIHNGLFIQSHKKGKFFEKRHRPCTWYLSWMISTWPEQVPYERSAVLYKEICPYKHDWGKIVQEMKLQTSI